MARLVVLLLSLVAGCARLTTPSRGDATRDAPGDRRRVELSPDTRADSPSPDLAGKDLPPRDAPKDLATKDAAKKDLAAPLDPPPKPDVALPKPDLPKPDAQKKDAAKPDLVGSAKVVFVSSQLFGCNLGGLEGADTKCQVLAANAGHKGIFRAWLSDSTRTAEARLTHATVPYRLVNGTIVASNWTDLTDGTLAAPIDRTETGGVPPVSTFAVCSLDKIVWSSTNASGNYPVPSWAGQPGYFGADWKSNGAVVDGASVGNWTSTGSSWSHNCQMGGQCSLTTASLYCVEQ